jgi:hypothetical protein
MGKSLSGVGAWLVVGCIAAIGLALAGGSKPKAVDSSRAAPHVAPHVEAPAQPTKPLFSESLRELAPASRLSLARDFASYGLKTPAERREAYALALTLVQHFPPTDPSAREAAAFEREVVARQNLPAADKRPVTESQLLAFATKLLPDGRNATGASVNGPTHADAAPQGHAARPTYPPTYVAASPGGEVRVRGYYRSDGTYVRPHTRRAPKR